MKSLVKTAALSAALVGVFVAPAVSFAQSNEPLTRAEVRGQLQQLEQAGYRPDTNDLHYPDKIQAAEARVGQQDGYGAGVAGSSQSGGRDDGAASSYSPPLYKGH